METLYQLALFFLYLLITVIVTGNAFYWKEDRRFFFLNFRQVPTGLSIFSFCATWLGSIPIIGYIISFYTVGEHAFLGEVIGWIGAVLLFPLLFSNLRNSHALSIPQWISQKHREPELRKITAGACLVVFLLFLSIEFRGFSSIICSMFGTNRVVASILIYTCVLYTTFGGLPSIVRSDAMNLLLMMVGLLWACGMMTSQFSSPLEIPERAKDLFPELFRIDLLSPASWYYILGSLVSIVAVSSNPLFLTRIMAARTKAGAMAMLTIAPFILGTIYLALTLYGLGGKILAPGIDTQITNFAFASLANQVLPPLAKTVFLLAVLAACISTANSQLLIASCSACYDLLGDRGNTPLEVYHEDRFLFNVRLAIAIIATLALGISFLELSDILLLNRYCFSFLGIFLFLPLYLPRKNLLFGWSAILSSGTFLILATAYFLRLSPEQLMITVLLLEFLLWNVSALRGEKAHETSRL
ncbi:MAG TPA: hypothetical protein PLW97_02380 [Synergistaceae bacterium]|nr:hypothetical protein [Synergistaceae bacterium]